MKKPFWGMIVTFAVLLSIVFPTSVFAVNLPLTLWGSLLINGDPAPVGTTVEARGENVRTDIRDNPLTTTETGKYGTHGMGKHLIVQLEEDEISPDTLISFYINGVEADQSFEWQDLQDPEIPTDLSVAIPVSRIETTTVLSSSKNPSIVGNSITLTATVSGLESTSQTPGGLVYFYDGTTPLGGYSLNSSTAKYTTSALTRGTHNLKAVYTGDSNFSGSEDTFTQTVNSSSGGGGGSSGEGIPNTTTATTTAQPTPTPSATPSGSAPLKILDLSGFMDDTGKMLRSFEGESLDGKAKISIKAGTVCRTVDGDILTQITIQQVDNPGGTPSPSAIFGMAGLCYDIQPGGAQFSQPISITLVYDPTQIPTGQKPYIAWWNYATDKWEKLETFSIDEGSNTITVNVTHFTVYSALYSKLPVSTTPASQATTSTPMPAQTPAPTPNSSSSTWIVIGFIALFIVVVLIVVYFILKRKSNPKIP